jgi:phage terminase small subunit
VLIDSLIPKHQAFIREYLKDRNGSQAAIRAGYSAHTSRVIASRLTANVNIRAAIDEMENRIAAKDIDELSLWRKELQTLAFVNVPTDEFKYDHKLRAADMLGKHYGAYASESGSAAAFAIQINLGNVTDD